MIGGIIMQATSILLIVKISQEKWIESLCSGDAWFGAINNYIMQAETSGNNEQGDRYEGIFARCRRESEIIKKYSMRFGNDLEIIEENDYCLLRRKSSRNMLAFCMYAFTEKEMINLKIGEKISDDTYKATCEFIVDKKMFDGFLQDGSLETQVCGFYCSPGHFFEALEKGIKERGYRFKRNKIVYDIDLSKEFDLEPDLDYSELWHKRTDLDYQHEERILIYNENPNLNGTIMNYDPVSTHSGNFSFGQLRIIANIILEEKS